MAQLIVLYKHPADTAAFDAYYESTHIPVAKKIPGLRRYEVSRGPVQKAGGDSPYRLIAVLSFDSLAAVQAGLASPEGQAAAADLGHFAQAGVELLMSETQVV